MKFHILHAFLVIALLAVNSCAGAPTSLPVKPTTPEASTTEPVPTQPPSDHLEIKTVSSSKPRLTAPASNDQNLQKLVEGNNLFTFDLYQSLREKEGNLFFSPYSISLALAMTYAGARGETASQMADTLEFNLPQEQLHPAFNQLDLLLHSRGENVQDNGESGFSLNIINSLWGQEGYAFLPEFLDSLAENYGAGLRLLDFANAAEASRQLINDWVMEQTNERIKELIPARVINALTRLVLVNAIYFNAAWASPFEAELTQPGEFSLLDGSSVNVPMMNQTGLYGYARGQDFQAVELPYQGHEMSMVVLHPDPEIYEDFESSLDAERLEAILAEMTTANLDLSVPKFEYDTDLPLAEVLQAMGMIDAFQAGQADFSGMDGTNELFLQDVLHKAFVSVDETGTEATAATAVIVGLTSMPTETAFVKINSPFIFMIRDTQTGSILFLGRVLNPAS